MAGANFTDLKLSDVEFSDEFVKSATGYSFGLTYDIDLALGLGVNTGLVFIQHNVKFDDDSSYGDGLNRFSWGLAIGAGVDIVKVVRVMYQYDWGLSSLTADNVERAVNSKARSNRITVGILF
ncbi:MAG: PorT family protein [Rikenellaceae bacterium]|nr:PorT family protein [Rikenellaceae bacterium]